MTTRGDESAKDEATAGELTTFAPAPNVIYFYYIKRPVEGSKAHDRPSENRRHKHGEIRVFLYHNRGNEPINPGLVNNLIKMVSDGDLIPAGYAVADLVLRHKGKMLFVWDEDGYTLEDVNFTFDSETTGKQECKYPPTAGTHPSFNDFTSVKISDSLSYVHGTNKRLRADGRPLGPCSERLQVRFTPAPKQGMVDDEAATNTGP